MKYSEEEIQQAIKDTVEKMDISQLKIYVYHDMFRGLVESKNPRVAIEEFMNDYHQWVKDSDKVRG